MPRKQNADKVLATHQARARSNANAALKVLIDLMNDPKGDGRVRQAAAARVLDIGFGRPGSQAPGEAAAIQIRLIPGDTDL